MNLLLITTSFPDSNEGSAAAGSFVADFARVLADENINVTVIAPGKKTSKDSGIIEIRRFFVPRLPLSLLKPWNPLHCSMIITTLRNGQTAVNLACTEHKYDHILALWALPSGEWARQAGKRFNIPYSIWALGSDIWSLGRIPVIRSMLRVVLRQAQMCFADGYRLAADVAKIGDISCDFLASTRILPISQHRIYKQQPPYRLAYLGRWHPNKGTDLLMDALKQLTDEDWSKIEEVRIFGGGPLNGVVQDGATTLQKQGRPLLVGSYIDRKEAAELLAWADYLIIPSRIESIPVVFSDAMQSGCPVIATPVGDLSRLITKYACGITTEDVDTRSITRGIQEALIANPYRFSDGVEHAKKDFDIYENVRLFMRALKR